jgi:hypothetical protein
MFATKITKARQWRWAFVLLALHLKRLGGAVHPEFHDRPFRPHLARTLNRGIDGIAHLDADKLANVVYDGTAGGEEEG